MNKTVRRRPRVFAVNQGGKIAYQFACGLCDQGPMFGKKFRRHLVTAHKMRDRTAINLVTRAARRYKERRAHAI